MTQFNLSEWALRHRSFVVYCMIVLLIAGTLSYSRLGRNEDPAFTFRTMVVQAGWPGATHRARAGRGFPRGGYPHRPRSSCPRAANQS